MTLILVIALAAAVIWWAERSTRHLALAAAGLCFVVAVLLFAVDDATRAILLAVMLAAAIFGASVVKYAHSGLKLIATDLPLLFAGTVPFFIVQYPLAVLAVVAGGVLLASGAAAAPAQTPGGVSLAANQLTPAITAGHANLADTIVGKPGADPTHGLDPTVGNLSPEVIASLTANPEFMAAMAAALGTQKPPVVEQAQENAQSDGGKPAAGATAQAEAPKRRGDAEEKKG